MVRVGVAGARGRMGRTVCQAVADADGLDLVARIDQGDDRRDLADAGAEVVVDFTTPAAVGENVTWYLEHGLHAVVGTTGWTDDDLARWRQRSDAGSANAMVAPNFALGAVLLMHLAQTASRHLPHVEVIELHHDGKSDAPSGTALRTAGLLARARRDAPKPVLGDDEHPGARGAEADGIRIHAIRLPGLVAHQEVLFGAEGQTLSIRHDTVDRTAFMPGVLLAIREVPNRRGLTVGLEHLLDLGEP
ncbi:MAG: 4-hydroxy-tetrahydrodipicolinate reductase [Actinobacteria bacterium]|nr:4-hydroxy-tetrahydrodipicolinate reductase [Actinomycetota bacterium]